MKGQHDIFRVRIMTAKKGDARAKRERETREGKGFANTRHTSISSSATSDSATSDEDGSSSMVDD